MRDTTKIPATALFSAIGEPKGSSSELRVILSNDSEREVLSLSDRLAQRVSCKTQELVSEITESAEQIRELCRSLSLRSYELGQEEGEEQSARIARSEIERARLLADLEVGGELRDRLDSEVARERRWGRIICCLGYGLGLATGALICAVL